MKIRNLLALLLLLAGSLLAAPSSLRAAAPCIKHTFVSAKPDSADQTLISTDEWNACHTIEGGNLSGSSTASGGTIILWPGYDGYTATPAPIARNLGLSSTLTTSQTESPPGGNYNAGVYADTTVDVAASETAVNKYYSGLFRAQIPSTNTKTVGELNAFGLVTNYNGAGAVTNVSGLFNSVGVSGTVTGQIDGVWSGLFINHDFNTGERATTYTADSRSYGAATVGTLIGFRSNIGAWDTSTITNLQAITIDSPSRDAGASITNNTGLYFAQQSVGSGTNYTIDAANSTAQSRFGGPVHFATIDATSVGIGTASPGAPLEVNISQNADTRALILNPTSGTAASASLLFGTAPSGGAYGYLVHHSAAYTTTSTYDVAGGTSLVAAGSGAGTSGTLALVSDRNPITFYASANGSTFPRLMTLLTNGNLGVGITDPPDRLSVLGSVKAYSAFTDAGNYERASLSHVTGTGATLAAETAGTGGDNLNVTLTPAGTGGVTLGANYQQFTEMTAPAAGAVNTARLYAQDNGAGKTQLCALFPSGAAQCFATEP